MTYLEKLKDPRWQKRRLEIFERDKFTCTQCFDSETTLHVHHIVYVKGYDPWDYEDDRLLTLCEKCHAETTKFLKETFEPETAFQLKDKLRDGFIQSCFLTLIKFSTPQQFNDLIYVLWELSSHTDDVIEILRGVSRIKDTTSIETTRRWRPDLIKSTECQESEQ